MPQDHDIIIAAYGWQHESWEDAFYPDDLPADWQLSYYSNEFSAVVIPRGLVQSADAECFATWADDVNPGFRFMVELPAGGGLQATLQHCGLLQETLAGVLVPAAGSQLDVIGDMLPGVPVYLLDQPQPGQPPAALSAADVLLARSISEPAQLVEIPPPVNLLMLQQVVNEPKLLRQLIEYSRNLAEAAGDSWLVFGGAVPSVEDMRNCRIIAELSAV